LTFLASLALALALGTGAPLPKAEAPSGVPPLLFSYQWDSPACGEDYCWLTVSGDPDDWSVIVAWNYGTIEQSDSQILLDGVVVVR
jgi:hypothetical protein